MQDAVGKGSPVASLASLQRLIIELTIVLYNGHAALMIFFVISGYVLGLSLDKGRGKPAVYSRFYFRRILRIYPAHVVAIGFIAGALSLIDRAAVFPAASQLYRAMFAQPFSAFDGLTNVLLLSVTMNGIAWTLALEMAVSVAFPLLYLASRHRSWWVRGGLLVGLLGMSLLEGGHDVHAAGSFFIARLEPSTLRQLLVGLEPVLRIIDDLAVYTYVFYLGLIAEPALKTIMPKLEGRRGTALMWFTVFFTIVASTARWLPLEVAGATFLVFYGASIHSSNRLTRVLDHPFFVRMGTISYSFYLYHYVILFCIARVMFRVVAPGWIGQWPLPFVVALTLLAFGVTTLMASASYRFVEAPMITFSKNALARRRARPPLVPDPLLPETERRGMDIAGSV